MIQFNGPIDLLSYWILMYLESENDTNVDDTVTNIGDIEMVQIDIDVPLFYSSNTSQSDSSDDKSVIILTDPGGG